MAQKRVPVPPARPSRSRQEPPAPPPPPPAPPPPAPAPVARRPISRDSRLRVLVAGGSGLLGTELIGRLGAAGHTVERLVRRPPRGEDEHSWAPDAKIVDFRLLERVDAVICLSGAPLAHLPWTRGYKEQIRRSRVKATQALVEAMSMASSPPPIFLSASAVGWYGDRPGETLTEASPRGTGFLADVVEAWEGAARLAPPRTRTVLLRTGVVISPKGGALGPLGLATRLGLGSTVGTGAQQWPWISLRDHASAVLHLLTSGLEGPVNLTGPTAATSESITRRVAADLHRPHLLRLPEAVVAAGAGEMGRELLLADQRVVPEKLLEDGFVFRDATSDDAVDAALS